MTQASISLLLKKNKDPLICESYCPISFLCCNYKILTKVLAGRLEKITPKLIHPDQTGWYIMLTTLQRLLDMCLPTIKPNNVEPELVLSLDAENTFNRIECNYLFASLERFGFGPTFCTQIKVLYMVPQASVRVNKIILDYFPLSQGSRQGCPLSPQIFDMPSSP